MKLWHKIFLCTFLLFELAFNASMVFLIQRSFRTTLEKEVERGLNEQLVVQSVLAANSSYTMDKFGYSEQQAREFLQFLFRDYTRYFDQKGVYLELLDNQNKTVYSTFPVPYDGPREELANPLPDKRQYIIRDIGDSSYLFVTSLITDRKWKLTYIRDISNVYADRTSLYGFYIRLNLFLAILLAAALFVLTWFLTRPIRDLTESVQAIEKGGYSSRVEAGSRDEIGVLAQSVNTMAAAVETTFEELNRSARAKQHFIECLTHELKTPLTSIIGYAEFLRTTKHSPDHSRRAVDYIYKEGKRLESLSFRLMDLILLDNRSLALDRQDLSLLCREAEETFRPLLLGNNLELEVTAEPAVAAIDPDLMKVVLTNLLDNAVKASEPGGRIYLSCGPAESGGCEVEVRDEGRGIAEKDLPRVFEPFYTTGEASPSPQAGAGLGLSICTRIVKLHHGAIHIQSEEGDGTSVRVVLP